MNKTFIWNTEYEVFAASSDTVENARRLLYNKFVEKSKKYLIDEKDMEGLSKNCIPSYVLHRAESVFSYNLESFIEIYKREPDEILEERQATIYDHTNE